jgi:hypothetical protein
VFIPNARAKFANYAAMVDAGLVGPVEIVARIG